MRRYGPDLKLTAKRAAPDGKRSYGVAIDLSGRRVAVGYEDTTSVSILDAKTLAPLAKAQTSDVTNGNLEGRLVARRRNARRRRAAQAQFHGEWRRFLRRFDSAGRRKGEDVAASDNTIMDIQPCGDGFAFAAPTRVRPPLRTRRREDASRPAHGRHARQARIGVRALARRRLCAIRPGLRRAQARAVRSRRGVADGFADSSARHC